MLIEAPYINQCWLTAPDIALRATTSLLMPTCPGMKSGTGRIKGGTSDSTVTNCSLSLHPDRASSITGKQTFVASFGKGDGHVFEQEIIFPYTPISENRES